MKYTHSKYCTKLAPPATPAPIKNNIRPSSRKTCKVSVFGINPEAQELATKYSIRSAPTFVVINGDNVKVVKQEELEETSAKNCD